jgi:hypothetical protein
LLSKQLQWGRSLGSCGNATAAASSAVETRFNGAAALGAAETALALHTAKTAICECFCESSLFRVRQVSIKPLSETAIRVISPCTNTGILHARGAYVYVITTPLAGILTIGLHKSSVFKEHVFP